MPMMPTYDFETEADAIKRKQAIADALQQSALAPMQMPTQPGVKLSGVNVLAKLLEGYVAGKKSDEAKADRTALSQRYGDELKSGMEQYYKTMQGYETPSMALTPNEDGSPQMVKSPAIERKQSSMPSPPTIPSSVTWLCSSSRKKARTSLRRRTCSPSLRRKAYLRTPTTLRLGNRSAS